MHRAGMTWTEATSLKRWEIRYLNEHLDDIDTMRENRSRLK